MADTKITGLQTPGAFPVVPSTDVLPIVIVADNSMAASGSTRKVTVNQLLGAGGTATLASATITGDLTVRTNQLVVNSSGSFVGKSAGAVGTDGVQLLAGGFSGFSASATTALFVNRNTSDGTVLQLGRSGASAADFGAIAGGGFTVGLSGSEWMRINATGLGVGEAASVARLQPRGSTSDSSAYVIYAKNSGGSVINFMRNDGRFIVGNGTTDNFIVTETGNVGIGVTPSAWNASFRGIDISTGGAIAGSSDSVRLFSNSAFNTAGNNVYKNAATAGRYDIQGNVHTWNISTNAPSVGGTITFSPAMTLDASGNLLVRKTASGGTTLGVELLATGQINGATANQDNLNIYNTTAAAYRFYVNAAGTVFATNTTISAISDARFKENVQDIDVGLGAILALKPRKFDWKDGKGKNIKGDRGFIAQEFETVFPNLIDEWKENAPEGEAPYKSVRQDLIPVLVKAIQELTARVQTLETR